MAKTWADWLDHVMPECPGVTPVFAQLHIKKAAIEFIKNSRVLRGWFGPADTVAGQADYPLATGFSLPPNTVATYLNAASLDDVPLDIETPDYLDAYRRQGVGQSDVAILSNPAVLTVNGTPAAAGNKLRIDICYTLTDSASGVDDWLYDTYCDDIACGAKARLMQMKNRPYTNVPEAAVQQAMFDAGWKEAKIKAFKGSGRSRRRVIPAPF